MKRRENNMRENIKHNENVINIRRRFKRGEIYWIDFPERGKDSRLQAGIRPAIIIVNDMAGKHSPVLQCIPITSQIKREDMPVHVCLNSGELQKASMVLGEQLGSIDTYRIKEKWEKFLKKIWTWLI
jgi:mRNA interferase MazF